MVPAWLAVPFRTSGFVYVPDDTSWKKLTVSTICYWGKIPHTWDLMQNQSGSLSWGSLQGPWRSLQDLWKDLKNTCNYVYLLFFYVIELKDCQENA